jgi:DNA-binding NarL/FixJ family response regulator
MDLQLPGQGGIAAIRDIMAAIPTVRILVITLYEDDDSVFAALRAGARGYVLKDSDEEDMVRAIRAIAAGESLFSPTVASRLLASFAQVRPVTPSPFPTLTDRERDILHLMAKGRSNAAMPTSWSSVSRRSRTMSAPSSASSRWPTGQRSSYALVRPDLASE